MEIIVVADKQASKYLSNRENLSTVDGLPVTIGNIVEGITGIEPLVWDGKRWVNSSPDILIHNQQITNKDEAEALLRCLKDGVSGSVGFRGRGNYDTIIIGCDPDVAEGYLVAALEGYFGYEDITMTFPPLGDAGTPDPRLRDKVNKLLYPSTTDRAKAAKVIVVAGEKASKLLSGRGDLGFTDKHSVHFGDIVEGELDAGPSVRNEERWAVESHNVLIHSRQITNKDEAKSLVARLQSDDKYDTVIVGCDPGNTLYHLDHILEKAFGSNNVNIIYPSLYPGCTEFDSLRNRISGLLDLPAIEKVNVKSEKSEKSEESEESEESVGKGNHQGEVRHLRVTLTSTSKGGSTPTVIDVLFNEGTNIELDFRERTQDTA